MQNNQLSRLLTTLFFLVGVFSTLVGISFWGVSLFYLGIVVFIVISIVLKHRIHIANGDIPLYVLLLSIAVSTIVNIRNKDILCYGDSWNKANTLKAIVIIVLYGGMVMIFSPEERTAIKKYFIKGVYISCFLQMISGIIQAYCWYLKEIEINTIIFQSILKIDLDVNWTLIENGLIRLTGIGWEPAYFSMAMVAGYLFSKKRIMRVLFICMGFLSTSRTGIIIMIAAIMLENAKRIKINVNSLVKWLFFVLIVVGVLYALFSTPFINQIVIYSFDSLKNWDTTMSGRTHFHYLLYFPDLLLVISLVNFLFGYGIGSSGFPYTFFYSIEFAARSEAWCVENDYINCFFGLGVIGFFCFYYIVLKAIKNEKCTNIRNLLICYLVAGVFYIYLGSWIVFLIVLSFDSNSSSIYEVT